MIMYRTKKIVKKQIFQKKIIQLKNRRHHTVKIHLKYQVL